MLSKEIVKFQLKHVKDVITFAESIEKLILYDPKIQYDTFKD